MESDCPLVDLAPELVLNIAENLSRADLLNLRLVSRGVAERTQPAMLENVFCDLHIVLGLKASLARARQIADHDLFVKAVTEVILYNERPDRSLLDQPDRLRVADYDNTNGDAVEIRRQRLQMFKGWMLEYEDLIKSDSDYQTLSHIFGRLKDAGRCVYLVLDNIPDPLAENEDFSIKDLRTMAEAYNSVTHPGTGTGGRRSEDGPVDICSLPLDPDADEQRSGDVFIHALRLSGLRPKSLITNGLYWGFQVRAFSKPNGFLSIKDSFSEIEQMSLTIFDTPMLCDLHSEDEDILSLVTFLTSLAGTLRLLGLGMHYKTLNFGADRARSIWPDSVSKMFLQLVRTEVVFPCLQKVLLRRLWTEEEILCGFLSRHKATLKTISYRDIRIKGDMGGLLSEELNEKSKGVLVRAGLPNPEETSNVIPWNTPWNEDEDEEEED